MNVRFLGSMVSAAVLALAVAGCATSTPSSGPSFFVTSVGGGKGADLGGLAGADKHCQTLAAATGTGRQDVACLPEHAGVRVDAGGQCERPHRHRAVEEREGCRDRHQRGRTARQQQPHQADVVDRNGRRGERSWRHAQQARRPHRHAAERHGVYGRRRQDVRQLDQERRGFRHRRPHRPRWPAHGPVAVRTSWNSSHATKGCSDPALVSTGGAGLLYCFAAK